MESLRLLISLIIVCGQFILAIEYLLALESIHVGPTYTTLNDRAPHILIIMLLYMHGTWLSMKSHNWQGPILIYSYTNKNQLRDEGDRGQSTNHAQLNA